MAFERFWRAFWTLDQDIISINAAIFSRKQQLNMLCGHFDIALNLDLNETREWPGHIRQLKKMLQVLVANSATTIIRPEAIEGEQNMSGSEIIPCAPCAQSPMRKESCVLIQKTWMDSGGNISLVARRLGVSRTTIYKHLKGL